jgi:uncharacterized protein
MSLTRRDFLRNSALAAALATATPAAQAVESRNGMPYRTLGSTGEAVSLLGIGGYHIGVASLSDEQSIALMRRAVDEGVNFFDNAWDYTGGRSERLMGKALKDGYRDQVFLMTKVLDRSRQGAQQQLEDSLRRLDVDVIDLWQIHSVQNPRDAQSVYEDGALDVAAKARDEGKVRFIGFTGHVQPEGHLAMLERGFDFATVQMPLSVFDHHYHSFAGQVLPKLQEKKMGAIAMKVLGGRGQILAPGNLSAEEALHYAMNLPIATVVSGMDTIQRLEENLRIAKSFQPMKADATAALLERVKQAASGGQHEYYKDPESV